MNVIGVSGQARMGKDCLADKLYEHEEFAHWDRASFARGVKDIYSKAFGVSQEFIEEWKVKDETPPGFNMPLRKGLQFIGDGFRNIQSEVWVNQPFMTETPKIISDVRYPNEFNRIHKEGGINILIARPDKLNDDSNGSEALIRPYVKWAMDNIKETFVLDGYDFGEDAPKDIDMFNLFVMNDSTLEDYYKQIDEVVVPYVKNYKFN